LWPNFREAYEDDQERRNLIRFRKEFRKLLESLSVINKTLRPKKEMDWLSRMAPELRMEIKKRNQPTTLNREQLADPMPVVEDIRINALPVGFRGKAGFPSASKAAQSFGAVPHLIVRKRGQDVRERTVSVQYGNTTVNIMDLLSCA
jgi:hypothetical protein